MEAASNALASGSSKFIEEDLKCLRI